VAAVQRDDIRNVASRRRDFAHLVHSLDSWATTKLLRSGQLSPAEAGALQTFIGGGAIPQALAAKCAAGGSRCCPHCGLAEETLEHRLWQCPVWDAAREAALLLEPSLGLAGPQALRALLPQGVALTGTLPLNRELADARSRAEAAVTNIPEQLLVFVGNATTVWTDGACQMSPPLGSILVAGSLGPPGRWG